MIPVLCGALTGLRTFWLVDDPLGRDPMMTVDTSENLYFLRNLFDRVRGSFSLLLGDSLRPQQRLPIADRYSEIRSSKITHHGEDNPDDFSFAVKKRTARTTRSSLCIVDNFVGQDITNMALRDNRADQMSASEFFHYLFRITFGCLGNRLKCLFAG